MSTHYQTLTREISSDLLSLRNSQPEVMQSFNALGKAALAAKAIDAKTKELIALAVGVAARCDGCIGFHVKTLVRLGASLEELHETLAIAIYMGGGPAAMYAANAIAAYREFTATPVAVTSAG